MLFTIIKLERQNELLIERKNAVEKDMSDLSDADLSALVTDLQSMMTSTPIIAAKTGGLYRQVIDYRDNSENGIGLDIDFQTINGNQESYYIYEDYVSYENVANALQKFYKFSKDKKNELKIKVKEYSDQAFNYKKMIKLWDRSLENSIKEFKCQTTNIQIVNLK